MKVGDSITKTKRYSKFLYCKYGGLETEVPLGTIGKIIKIFKKDKFEVKFENGRRWTLDISEFNGVVVQFG